MLSSLFLWRLASQTVVLLFACCFSFLAVILCFGGTLWRSERYGCFSVLQGEYWEHGWPLQYLSRETSEVSSRHEVWAGVNHFQWSSLAIDIFVCLALQVVICTVAYRLACKIRASRPQWTFSLGQLLIVLSMTCLLLGSLSKSIASARRERRVLVSLHHINPDIRGKLNCVSPKWLSRLIGTTQHRLDVLTGIGSLRLSLPDTGKGSIGPELLQSLALLEHLEEVEIFSDSLTDDELRLIFDNWKHLRLKVLTVYSPHITGVAFKDAHCLCDLHAIRIKGTGVDDKGFANLTLLPLLKEIDARQAKITSRSLHQSKRLANLRSFQIEQTSIQPEEFAELEQRGISHERYGSSSLLNADPLVILEEEEEKLGINLEP